MYNSTLKGNKLLTQAVTWMHFEIIMLSELCQSQQSNTRSTDVQ